MRKINHLWLGVYILVGIIAVILLFMLPNKKFSVSSPLPDYLTGYKNQQVSTIDLWTPIFDYIQSAISYQKATAKSALIYDLTSKKVLFEKNPKEKLPMASLTKIMTAIVALENKKANDSYIVKKENLVGENSMGLIPGEILNLNELLYGLILSSGNDSAEVIASNFNGGRSEFIKAMNKKAESLGLTDTNFTNPSGLEGDGVQYTTASDLLVITNYALSNFPQFREVVATVEHSIPQTNTHKAYYLWNETSLLTTYPGVKGVKLGFTPEAGYSMVTYLEYKDHKIVGILLNSQNRRQEMKDLLDYSLRSLGIEPPPHS